MDQIDEIRSSNRSVEKKVTVFHGILNSDLPDVEKTNNRLRQEAQLLVQAGQDTTGKWHFRLRSLGLKHDRRYPREHYLSRTSQSTHP